MTENKLPFATIEEAIEDIRQGRMIVLVDDEDRENEGDLTMAAEKITPEAINFMAKFGRGLICLSLSEQRCETLDLKPISPRNTSMFGTPFCEPIDARRGTTTGTSAWDRATTILVATDPHTKPEDLARPGHVYTLRARNGGVLVRAGQTEASVDLARIAGLEPAGVICEIMNEDGTMARIPQLVEFCRMHGTEARHRGEPDPLPHAARTQRAPHRRIRSAHQVWRLPHDRVFERRGSRNSRGSGARRSGEQCPGVSDEGETPPLVRVHSHCLTGDVLGSTACDCREMLERSLEAIAAEDRGVFVYLHHTGRGFRIDSRNDEVAALPQIIFHERGHVERDPSVQRVIQHESGIGAQILKDLGLRRIRVLTNLPRKVVALKGYGIEIADQVPLAIKPAKQSHQVI